MDKVKLARNINIKWDPITDDGVVRMGLLDHAVDADGVTRFVLPEDSYGHIETLAQIKARLIEDEIVDPVTGQTISNVSGAGLMLLIKKVVDQIVVEVEAELVNADQEVQ